ncbi:hypothetical protein AQS8620_01438 [Aquimixticola soesokkakensis]|uniref:Lysozyme n=1 Tax=Aquimixticola soesokkakensis TaxID=1519096 RepID=A0A1Y5SDK2_9RHOB|nr:glycoside hydrolase family protein [Aquimixticola soesokkakensis]SLN38297.1 hypothetical protein AQS8620_01438 [Aquimixticola soesokkakensis]
MQTSEKGIEALELEENDVLKAYRDVVGKWTIGMGLTAASGVIVPKAGMTITKKQSQDLTRKALTLNYEPSVNSAMSGAKQHEFDAGVLFHWNTGAIKTASWVDLWRAKAGRAKIAARFRLWNKGNGKVIQGLVNRRERELKILFDGLYSSMSEPASASVAVARWVVVLSGDEKAKVLDDFMALGYLVGSNINNVHAFEVRRFQEDHGLSVDGKIGRATLSTLQRMVDAKAKTKPVASAAAVATVPAATSMTDVAQELSAAGISAAWLFVPLAFVCLFALWRAWHYRDAVAARLPRSLSKLAQFLRSI